MEKGNILWNWNYKIWNWKYKIWNWNINYGNGII